MTTNAEMVFVVKDSARSLTDVVVDVPDGLYELPRFEVPRPLERLMVGRTTLVIVHRLSTIPKADRIVVLVDSAVAEQRHP